MTIVIDTDILRWMFDKAQKANAKLVEEPAGKYAGPYTIPAEDFMDKLDPEGIHILCPDEPRDDCVLIITCTVIAKFADDSEGHESKIDVPFPFLLKLPDIHIVEIGIVNIGKNGHDGR